MQCESERVQADGADNREYFLAFNRKVTRQRIPISGNIELSRRCNLNCVHCYVGEQAEVRKRADRELSTARWQAVIDEITAAGCLYLLITGGEPLLRKDFTQIYLHAKRNGLLVTVFSNGTLIDERTLDLFSEYPPKAVEITIYGSTAGTHERITGVEGSFKRCLHGIAALRARQVNVKIKTMLMTLNQHELFAMQDMARQWGIKFRFDAALFPTFAGDRSPIRLRVPAESAIKKEFSDEGRASEWKNFYERMRDMPVSDNLYQCGAGQTFFHIDPYGNLQPCLMVTDLKYNLANGTFMTGWNEVMGQLQEKESTNGYACNRCDQRALCGVCPAFFYLENGAEEKRSDYLCTMGQLRFQEIERSYKP